MTDLRKLQPGLAVASFVDPQLVCAVNEHKRHERHDSVETLTAHSVARDIMDQTL